MKESKCKEEEEEEDDTNNSVEIYVKWKNIATASIC